LDTPGDCASRGRADANMTAEPGPPHDRSITTLNLIAEPFGRESRAAHLEEMGTYIPSSRGKRGTSWRLT
jgi:hypothetical protein